MKTHIRQAKLWTVVSVLVVSTFFAFYAPQTAEAISTGKILVSIYANGAGGSDIFSVRPDGTNLTQLTSSAGQSDSAKLSPDGTKIAFHTTRDGNDEIYVMDSDGGNEIRLTNDALSDTFPVWSEGSDKIVFVTQRNGHQDLYSMNPDGTSQTNLTSAFASGVGHKYHHGRIAQGNKIFFKHSSTLYSMDITGSNVFQITSSGVVGSWAVSENSTKIAFTETGVGVRVINKDGTGLTTIDIDDSHWVAGISGDGSKISYEYSVSGGDNDDLYVSDIDGSNYTRITNDTDFTYDSGFSPDSSKIIWTTGETTTWNAETMMIANTDGTGPYALLSMDDDYFKALGEWTVYLSAQGSSNTIINATVAATISIATSGTVTLSVTPAGGARLSSGSDTVTVSTNNTTGYNLSLSNQDTTTTLVSGGNTIDAHAGTQASPTSLVANKWAYRVDGAGGFGAGPTGVETNQASSSYSWAGVPSSASPVQLKTTGSTAVNDTTTVWYAVMVDSAAPNGTYSDTVTYTAVTN